MANILVEQRSSPAVIPPLQNGDRLTRTEFLRRYASMPRLSKAELIEGVVYVPPPVSLEFHGGPHFDLIGWLFLYRVATPGVDGGDNTTLLLDLDNVSQPDAFLRILPACGGQSRTTPDSYVGGAPELIAEIAASSASYDLHDKLDVYRRNGVSEYLVWRVLDRAIDWFILREDHYEPLARGADNVVRSEVFPGLWLDPDALVRGDLSTVGKIVQRGITTPEHAAFVHRLQQAAGGPSSG